MTLRERFDEKYVIVEPGGCWVWVGSMNTNGYGEIWIGRTADGRRRRAATHRVSWELHRGPIPNGLSVLHRCDNPVCVNPDHLFLGTQADNMADRKAKGRQPLGEKTGTAKVTSEDVIAIRELGGRLSHKQIADLFGISRRQVNSIVRRKAWAHCASETCREAAEKRRAAAIGGAS